MEASASKMAFLMHKVRGVLQQEKANSGTQPDHAGDNEYFADSIRDLEG
jgi:hypothetical protein